MRVVGDALESGPMTEPTRREVEEFVATQSQNPDFPGKFYQGGIELPHGIITENPYGEVGDCRRIWDLLDLSPGDWGGKTLLDAGCATGFYAMEWVRRGGASAVGFDSNPRSVEIARTFAGWAGISNAEFVASDFDDFDWGDASYDAVFALQILYHVADPERALRAVARAAKSLLVMILRCQPPQNFWTLGALVRQLEENGLRLTYLKEGTTVQGKWAVKAVRG